MIRVDEIDNTLYVSEVDQQPGYTHIKHYQVEFLRMRYLILFIAVFIIGFTGTVLLTQWFIDNQKKKGRWFND